MKRSNFEYEVKSHLYLYDCATNVNSNNWLESVWIKAPVFKLKDSKEKSIENYHLINLFQNGHSTKNLLFITCILKRRHLWKFIKENHRKSDEQNFLQTSLVNLFVDFFTISNMNLLKIVPDPWMIDIEKLWVGGTKALYQRRVLPDVSLSKKSLNKHYFRSCNP